MGDGDFRAGSDASHDQLSVEKFKSCSHFCIGMCVHKVKIILDLGQFYLHPDTRELKLRDVADVCV